MRSLCCTLLCALLMHQVSAGTLTFKIDAHKEECFYEDVDKVGQKVFVAYQVTQGGALDIDFSISDTSDQVIYNTDRDSDNRVLFLARNVGQHKFCFSNRMSTLTTKAVSFHVVVGDPFDSTRKKKKLAVTAVVERSITRLSEALSEIRNEQQYLRTRERVHRDTAEVTNERVLWGSIIQGIAMIALSGLQIFFLRRSFESKRRV
eukprot:NODE_7242_length_780_cov_137.202435_g7002_i0.p1 GENE.NODE_7242_length_780_cov_137.202435_g7002_i0~~NODE_7242_length_780_cov_137.202435_g7002_i0.p1  ORF type:complete len:224 (+),score=59.45 NODE_7242_length_780_cov_137.202435_g7002_i0:58-672(+)